MPQQRLLLGGGAGHRDRSRADPVRHLDRGERHAAGACGEHDGVARLHPADLDQPAVRRHVGHPDRRALERAHPLGPRHHRGGRHDGAFGVDAVVVLREEARQHADRLSDPQALDALADRLEHTCGLGAEPGGKAPDRFDVPVGPEEHLGPVQADGLHPEPHFARTGLAGLLVLDHEHLGAADLVESHRPGHPPRSPVLGNLGPAKHQSTMSVKL